MSYVALPWHQSQEVHSCPVCRRFSVIWLDLADHYCDCHLELVYQHSIPRLTLQSLTRLSGTPDYQALMCRLYLWLHQFNKKSPLKRLTDDLLTRHGALETVGFLYLIAFVCLLVWQGNTCPWHILTQWVFHQGEFCGILIACLIIHLCKIVTLFSLGFPIQCLRKPPAGFQSWCSFHCGQQYEGLISLHFAVICYYCLAEFPLFKNRGVSYFLNYHTDIKYHDGIFKVCFGSLSYPLVSLPLVLLILSL